MLTWVSASDDSDGEQPGDDAGGSEQPGGGGSEPLELAVCAAGVPHRLHAVPPKSGKPGRPPRLAVAVTAVTLPAFCAAAEKAATAAANGLLADLSVRFPESDLLDAFSVVYPQYWQTQPSAEDFASKLDVIKQRYCQAASYPGGDLRPLLDEGLLDIQTPLFREQAALKTQQIYKERARAATNASGRCPPVLSRGDSGDEGGGAEDEDGTSGLEACTSASAAAAPHIGLTTDLWRRLTVSSYSKSRLSEFAKLAELVLVMVPGSVEEERTFSTMSFIKSKLRNRLDEHLRPAVQLFSQRMFDLDSFPYDEALNIWRDAAPRGRYMANRM
jgi:hypothetical protein